MRSAEGCEEANLTKHSNEGVSSTARFMFDFQEMVGNAEEVEGGGADLTRFASSGVRMRHPVQNVHVSAS